MTFDPQAHLDALAKPQRSLGRLETLAVRLMMIQHRLDPVTRPRRLVLFAGDHGVVAQGISAWPSAVTGMMVATIAANRATSSALAAAHGCGLRLVDAGTLGPPLAAPPPFYLDAAVARGTADLSKVPAMSGDEFAAAWAIGVAEANAAVEQGCAIIIAGEMGIGNTTPAACLTMLLAGVPLGDAVGRGAGADDLTVARKQVVVADAVARAEPMLAADQAKAIASVAGFEIVAIAGFFAEGARRGATLLLDGYVTTAAALIAERLAPGTAAAMIAGHRSAEPGHAAALARLGLDPLLDWGMRLGEGSGALVALPLLDSGAALARDVALLADIGAARVD